MSIPDLVEFEDLTNLIGCGTLILGPPRTGKTVIISKLLQMLAPKMDAVFVLTVKDTAKQYINMGINPSFIFTDFQLTPTLLDDIIKAQEVRMDIYEKARDVELLTEILSLMMDREDVEAMKEELMENCIEDDIFDETLFKDQLRSLILEDIEDYIDAAKNRLDELIEGDETGFLEKATKYTTIYNVLMLFDINPHILVLYDDISAIAKTLTYGKVIGKTEDGSKTESRPFYNMLTTGRHKFITTIFISHSITSVFDSTQVGNFKYVICTTPKMFTNNKDRFGFGPDQRDLFFENLFESAKTKIEFDPDYEYSSIVYCPNPTDEHTFLMISHGADKYKVDKTKETPFDNLFELCKKGNRYSLKQGLNM